ncbi:hypothetical protein [Phormidium sp. CCY1219]|uniref:hypothetical protein n=1 Tax=Phormidium sp. CCY1219 TaxID=2886104 RepID=UPI002D1F6073|nr:hypothetical protein [Phormidium sp. CCY1219]MEB3826730.1 hypothetical protein [Phormidium sp. CCY1219]
MLDPESVWRGEVGKGLWGMKRSRRGITTEAIAWAVFFRSRQGVDSVQGVLSIGGGDRVRKGVKSFRVGASGRSSRRCND